MADRDKEPGQREADQDEPTQTPDPTGTGGNGSQPPDDGQQPAKDTAGKELEELKAALKSANDEAAQRRHRIKELEEQIKQRERAGMDESERLKAELEDLKGADIERGQLKTKVEALETAVAGQVAALLKDLDVPKHVQALLEPMGAADKLAYLVENRQAFVKADPVKKPDIDAANKGKAGKEPQKLDDKRKLEIRKRYRLR